MIRSFNLSSSSESASQALSKYFTFCATYPRKAIGREPAIRSIRTLPPAISWWIEAHLQIAFEIAFLLQASTCKDVILVRFDGIALRPLLNFTEFCFGS
jgi:hypothetical protein